MPSTRIDRYRGFDAPLPAVVAVGRSHQRRARPGLGRHRHPVWELCLLQEGHAEWFMADRTYRLSPGTLFLTPPRIDHGSVSGTIEPCRLFWVQFRLKPSSHPALYRTLGEAGPGAWNLPSPRHWLAMHERLIDECAQPRRDSPEVASATLSLLLHETVRSRSAEAAAEPPEAVAQMLAFIAAEPATRRTLADLQELTEFSRSRIHQLFRRSLGISPVTAMTQPRLQQARHLLRETDRPVTAIAYDLGFSSSQHFATAFRKRFGITPSAYRRNEF
ncbi:MAG: AraC family transcriptional regulator [Planctomycetota bacterium]